MSALDKEQFPRGALIGAAALIGFSLIATAAARWERVNHPNPTAEAAQLAPARSADLWFADDVNGSVSVRDSRSNKVVASLAPGTNGFIRSVMRGMVHERKRRGIGPAQPFRIAQWRDGHLALEDPATGRLIDLDAFGISNKDAFAELLNAQRAAS
jgi:putative photosynthetic complex assembly protein